MLITILQVLLLFCCCWLWFTMNFVISHMQYIGKQLVMYIGAAIDIGSNNEYQISENRKIYTFTYNQACSFKCPEGL